VPTASNYLFADGSAQYLERRFAAWIYPKDF
jgi:prepilin-type processing-associated H-X9-DG protein